MNDLKYLSQQTNWLKLRGMEKQNLLMMILMDYPFNNFLVGIYVNRFIFYELVHLTFVCLFASIFDMLLLVIWNSSHACLLQQKVCRCHFKSILLGIEKLKLISKCSFLLSCYQHPSDFKKDTMEGKKSHNFQFIVQLNLTGYLIRRIFLFPFLTAYFSFLVIDPSSAI